MATINKSHVHFNKPAMVMLSGQVKIGITVCTDLDLQNHPVHSYTKDRFTPCYRKAACYQQKVWHDSTIDLHTYTHNDGKVLEDFVQADVGQSVPYVFMALRDAVSKQEITETLWTSEEMFEMQELLAHAD